VNWRAGAARFVAARFVAVGVLRVVAMSLIVDSLLVLVHIESTAVDIERGGTRA
jgi:hypothetical protein